MEPHSPALSLQHNPVWSWDCFHNGCTLFICICVCVRVCACHRLMKGTCSSGTLKGIQRGGKPSASSLLLHSSSYWGLLCKIMPQGKISTQTFRLINRWSCVPSPCWMALFTGWIYLMKTILVVVASACDVAFELNTKTLGWTHSGQHSELWLNV